MLRLLILFSSLSTILTTLATPVSRWTQHGGSAKRCITDAEAQQISNNFFIITGGQGIFNRTVAEAALAANFSDSSESVASIVDEGGSSPINPLGPTFANKTAFIEANAKQPTTKFTELNLYHTCNVVFQRFEVTNLSPIPPRGISIFECVEAPEGNLFPWQIKQVYGELNSLAWLIDLGIYNATGNTLGSNQ